jgi:hypothetical protein
MPKKSREPAHDHSQPSDPGSVLRALGVAPDAPAEQALERVAAAAREQRIDGFRALALVCCAHYEVSAAERTPGQRTFLPEADRYRELLERAGLLAGLGPLAEPKTFAWMVSDFVDKGLHVMSFDQIFMTPMDQFLRGLDEEGEALVKADERTRAAYMLARHKHLTLKGKLSEILWKHESSRVEQEHVRADFMRRFGNEYLGMQQRYQDMKRLELRLEILKTEPESTEEQLEEMMRELFKVEQERLERLRLIQALPVMGVPEVGGYADEQALAEQAEQAKRLLRKIIALIHPDSWQYRMKEPKLSEEQKQVISEIRQEVLEVRLGELGYSPGTVGRDRRSPEYLQMILDTIVSAFENAGVSTQTELLLVGPLEARITQLEGYNAHLEHQIESIKQELVELLENETIKEFRTILAMPERHEAIRASLVEKVREYEKRCESLKQQLRGRSGGRP